MRPPCMGIIDVEGGKGDNVEEELPVGQCPKSSGSYTDDAAIIHK